MPKFLFSCLGSLKHYSKRWILLVVISCISLNLTVISPHVVAQVHEPQVYGTQAQLEVWEKVSSARNFYEAGNYNAALPLWQQAANTFAEQEDHPNQVMALSNLSLTYQAIGNWTEARQATNRAFNLLENEVTITPTEINRLLAQSLDVRGKLAFETGEPETALSDWQQSQQIYRSLNDDSGYVASLLNQAQAYQAMGQYLQAQRRLQQVPTQIAQSDDVALKISAGRSLAKIQRLLGDLADSERTLACLLNFEAGVDYEPATSGSQRFQNPNIGINPQAEMAPVCINLPEEISNIDRAALLDDWGNVQAAIAQRARDLGKWNPREPIQENKVNSAALRALTAFKQAAELSSSSTLTDLHFQAQVNALNLLTQFQPWLDETFVLLQQRLLLTSINVLLANGSLPPSQNTVYSRINYAESLLHLGDFLGNSDQVQRCETEFLSTSAEKPNELYCRAAELLGQTIWIAKEQLGDSRAIAYATGRLGALYVQTHQFVEARSLLNQAILLAESINAPDISYRWQQQLGKLLETQAKQEELNDPKKAQGIREDAIIAYRSALDTLGKVRSDLLAIDSGQSHINQLDMMVRI